MSAIEQEAFERLNFLDLPLFVNMRPADVRSRASRAVNDIVRGGSAANKERGRRRLGRLGGAALPYVIPALDVLSTAQRVEVVLALAPVAARMKLEAFGEPSDPERVLLFWNRMWETRSVEFRKSTARSLANRFARYGTAARAEELQALDTFALDALMEVLELPENRTGVERASRLIDVMAHVTGRGDRLEPSSSVDDAHKSVLRWRSWWSVYHSDFVPLLGSARISAFALETRYGRWALSAVADRLGRDASGRPIVVELWARMRVSVGLLLAGLALAYLLALPLGALAANRRRSWIDRGIALLVLVPYALSPAVIGVVAHRLGAPADGSLLWPALLLALVLLADPVRHQRAALMPVLQREFMQAARARGVPRWRAVLTHGLRNAMLPIATRAALELPTALTAVFVLERVFGLHGLCEATLTAVERLDASWLMALTLVGAVFSVLVLVANDLSYSLFDPRLRFHMRRKRA
ncbi:ABC transporter permease [Endomicrobium sp. AH-315-J14]|nr:ABC transporter permease [Endomicrobium sp. AH-315-J14]